MLRVKFEIIEIRTNSATYICVSVMLLYNYFCYTRKVKEIIENNIYCGCWCVLNIGVCDINL